MTTILLFIYEQKENAIQNTKLTGVGHTLWTSAKDLVTFTVDQSVRWDECSGSRGLHLTRATSPTMRLQQARNFIIYDKEEQIVRFSTLLFQDP